jgi:hypothetical protein
MVVQPSRGSLPLRVSYRKPTLTVVMNLTGNYPGWDSFLALFAEGRAMAKGLPIATVEPLSLSTIDKMSVPKVNFNASRYLRSQVSMGPHHF